jgi:hypothetical protein
VTGGRTALGAAALAGGGEAGVPFPTAAPGITVRENCESGVSTRGRAGPGATSDAPEVGWVDGRLGAAGRATGERGAAAGAPAGGSVDTATG